MDSLRVNKALQAKYEMIHQSGLCPEAKSLKLNNIIKPKLIRNMKAPSLCLKVSHFNVHYLF